LQQDSRLSVQQLSERVGLSPTPCWKRIKDLEARGVISGYTVRLDRKRLGLTLMVAEVNLNQHTRETVSAFEAAVAASPHILRCYSTTGQADFLLTLLVQDIDQYEQILMGQVRRSLADVSPLSQADGARQGFS
jgi:DNA-binding Lrp family transcriptional regulator